MFDLKKFDLKFILNLISNQLNDGDGFIIEKKDGVLLVKDLKGKILYKSKQ